MRSILPFVQKTKSVFPIIKTTLQNANVVMHLDILENHAVSIVAGAFTNFRLSAHRMPVWNGIFLIRGVLLTSKLT